MCLIKSSWIVGTSALVAAAFVSLPTDLGLSAQPSMSPARATAAAVNRTQKSDRAAIATAARDQARTITTVEVVGLRDATIVYRDRDGHVLYQTDPLSNVTVVSKGVVLPEITVRETTTSTVRPVATEVRSTGRQPEARPTASSRDPQPQPAAIPAASEKRKPIPEGCDPAASPIAAPQMAQILSKCMVSLPTTVKLASLN